MDDKPLTVAEAATYAGYHEKTLLKKLRRNELRGYQPGGAGCEWRIYRADLDAWIKGETPTRVRAA